MGLRPGNTRSEVFNDESIVIKVISVEADKIETCKIRCYFTTESLKLLESFGQFLVVTWGSEGEKTYIHTIELTTTISVIDYE